MANSSISSSLYSSNESSVRYTEEQEMSLYTNIRMVRLDKFTQSSKNYICSCVFVTRSY